MKGRVLGWIVGYLWVYGLCGGVVLAKKKEPCGEARGEAGRLACWKARYTEIDKRLNATYRRLRKSLGVKEKAEMKKDSRGWISYKEGQCTFAAEMQKKGAKNPKETDTYYACVSGYTEDRERYLRRAFGQEGVAKTTVEGEYRDTYGGVLIVKNKEGKLGFHLRVVRGPTYHIGEISGIFQRRGEQATFETADEYRPGVICKIQATFQGFTIDLQATDCQSFHGLRAYFGGLYRKTR